jgi:hypothetical protein
MARLFTEGFEMGDLLFWSTLNGGTILTTPVRSGSYACYLSNCVRNVPNLSEFYLRFGYHSDAYELTTPRLQWRNSSTVVGNLRTINNVLVAQTSSGTTVATGVTTLVDNIWYVIEIYIKIADSGGRIVVKLDGVTEIDFTGDTKPSTQTYIDNLNFPNLTGADSNIDDLALNDTTGTVDNSWCGDGHVIKKIVAGNGLVSQLTNSAGNQDNNYSFVDDYPSDGDTSYVETSTLNAYDLYALELFDVTGITINRAYVEARSRDTVAVGGLLALGIRTSSSQYWSTDKSLLTTYTAIKGPEYLLNPLTALPWTISEISDLQIGVKARS